tara:strand:- start:372 stop:839 length:468 start_codon:yes stop_codon:yes gene_type:complete
MDGERETFYEKNKFKIWVVVFLVIIGSISIASLVISTEPKKAYTESLYSDVLNPATFKHPSTGNHEILYSYPLNAGQGNNSGFFTIVMDGAFDVPLITFEVRDQLDRSIISNSPKIGKTTTVNFKGREDTTIVNLYINPGSPGIQLTSLSITLDR